MKVYKYNSSVFNLFDDLVKNIMNQEEHNFFVLKHQESLIITEETEVLFTTLASIFYEIGYRWHNNTPYILFKSFQGLDAQVDVNEKWFWCRYKTSLSGVIGLCHELTHALDEDVLSLDYDIDEVEVVAESVAYIVVKAITGISSKSSFDYILPYAGNDITKITAQKRKILKLASLILRKMDY